MKALSSATRTWGNKPLVPSDKSLGYFRVVRCAD